MSLGQLKKSRHIGFKFRSRVALPGKPAGEAELPALSDCANHANVAHQSLRAGPGVDSDTEVLGPYRTSEIITKIAARGPVSNGPARTRRSGVTSPRRPRPTRPKARRCRRGCPR